MNFMQSLEMTFLFYMLPTNFFFFLKRFLISCYVNFKDVIIIEIYDYLFV